MKRSARSLLSVSVLTPVVAAAAVVAAPANAAPATGPATTLLGRPPNTPVPDVPSLLAGVTQGGLPAGSALFPPASRRTRPAKPKNDVLGKANVVVYRTNGLDGTGRGVDNLAGARRTRTRGAKATNGPLSMLDTVGIEVPVVPRHR